MEGYDVLTTDDEKVGRVVGRRDGYLVVETGTLLKSRHGIPETFAHVDENENVVRITVSKNLVDDSPKVSDDEFDELEVARHYGLAAGEEAPTTAGDGDLVADDPAISAEEEGARHGIEPAEQRRAEVREDLRPEGEVEGESVGGQIHGDLWGSRRDEAR
jgi:hypothetical protein